MSQKKLKKLRKIETIAVEKKIESPVLGIRAIIKKNWKFLLILVLGIIGIYFNSLWGEFVSDDYATIPQNSNIMSVKAAWTDAPASFVVNLFKTLLALTFGIVNPISYHVACLLIYLLICILAFVFLSLFFSPLVSKVAIIFFSVLPVHVEAVSWISGIPYLITSVLVLFELINLVLYLKTKKKKYLVFLLVSLLISIFTDRIRGFSFVLLSGLIFLSFTEKFKFKIGLIKIVLLVLMAIGVLLLIGWPMIKTRIQSVNSGVNVSDSIFYNPFFQYPTAISKYLQLVLFPTDLTLYHTMYVTPAWLNWMILLVYLFTVGWFYFKDKRYFFALAFVFAATAPSMAPVKVSWLVAERYIFLGSLGIALLIGLLAEKYWEKAKLLIIGILTVLVMIFSTRVVLRNIDWQTNHNLWVSTCKVSPNSHNAWNNIGDDYDKLAQLEKTDEGKIRQYKNAIKGFAQSFAVKQNYADAYHNQANIFYKVGRLDLAREAYEIALYYNPDLYQTYITIIQMDLLEKNKEELLKHLSKIQAIKPNDLQVAYITAVAYNQIGMVDEAKKIADLLYSQFPNVAEIKGLYDSLKK